MIVSKINDLRELKIFSKNQYKLIELEREKLKNADLFFKEIIHQSFHATGKVNKKSSNEDIREILKNFIPKKLQTKNFYKIWISDMAQISEIFCDILNSDSLCFCLGTKRSCSRYHIDNVPMRLLVTYDGQGTEWLSNDIVDRNAYRDRLPNEKIVKDKSKIQFIDSWNISIFRGGEGGLLHRTPDKALKNPSLLMRLDHVSFWDDIIKHQINN